MVALTAFAMIAFACNSLFCRVALRETAIDATTFTSIRLVSGALMLWLIVQVRQGRALAPVRGDWPSAFALFVYAAGFSFAYRELAASTGALLLFGAVQTTMIGYSLRRGESLRVTQLAGLLLALGGLVGLLLPGLSAPPVGGSLLMLTAGVAWGVYSLRGKTQGSPLQVTAGNFLRTVPITLALSAAMLPLGSIDPAGVVYAVLSGALASGVGYALWYAVLPSIRATTAATVQLSVPPLAALGGIAFLGETMTWRLLLATAAILGGIAMVTLAPKKK
ncbi:MAG TPA: DMT family transporter [Steroidobacteraceae bacterium]|nr:DMT family transporter [Steroidobacteraceae bacterium]